VVPLYCFDPRHFKGTWHFGFPKTGPFRAKFLIESIRNLREQLKTVNRLVLSILYKRLLKIIKVFFLDQKKIQIVVMFLVCETQGTQTIWTPPHILNIIVFPRLLLCIVNFGTIITTATIIFSVIPGGEGVLQTNFIWGCSARSLDPLPFHILNFIIRTLSHIKFGKSGPFHILNLENWDPFTN